MGFRLFAATPHGGFCSTESLIMTLYLEYYVVLTYIIEKALLPKAYAKGSRAL